MNYKRHSISGEDGQNNPPPIGPNSLADLQKGLHICGDSSSASSPPPAWATKTLYDPEKIKQLFEQNALSFLLSCHTAITIGFSMPGLLKPLVFTGESSTPAKANKRYLATANELVKWHLSDIFDTSSESFASLQMVRTYHGAVRNRMKQDPKLDPTATWISAYNMACVQVGFFGPIMLHPTQYGLRSKQVSNKDLSNYVAFWRCVGYQLGIPDEFNACGLGFDNAIKLVNEIAEQVLLPDVNHPEPMTNATREIYIEGFNMVFGGFPVFTANSSLALAFHILGWSPQRQPYPKMRACEWVRFWGMRLMCWMMANVPLVGRLLSWAVLKAMGALVESADNASMEVALRESGLCPGRHHLDQQVASDLRSRRCPKAQRMHGQGAVTADLDLRESAPARPRNFCSRHALCFTITAVFSTLAMLFLGILLSLCTAVVFMLT